MIESRRFSSRHHSHTDAHAMKQGQIQIQSLSSRPCNHSYRSSSHHDPNRSHSDHSTDIPIATSDVIEAPVPTTAIATHPTTDPRLTGTLPVMTEDLDIDPGNIITNQTEILFHFMDSILETQGQKTQTSHN